MFGLWLNRVINSIPNIQRWQGKNLLSKNMNDATHQWQVSIIADILCRIEKDVFGNKDIDEVTLLRKCIYHDVLEHLTGDILSGVKRKTVDMSNAIRNVEEILYKENIEELIPPVYRSEFENYLLDPKDGLKTIEGQILQAADNLAALNECMLEVKLGNPFFEAPMKQILLELNNMELKSVKYFLENEFDNFKL